MTNNHSAQLELHNDDAALPPWVVVFRVSHRLSIPDQPPLSQFDGLLLCQLNHAEPEQANDPPVAFVYTVWTSQKRFALAELRFRDWLVQLQRGDGNVEIERQAAQCQIRSVPKKKSKRKWLGIAWLIFVHLGTVAAGLEIIRNHYEWAFISPELKLVSPTKRYEYYRDESIDFDLEISNLTRSGVSTVEVECVELTPIGQTEPGDKETKYILLNPDEPITLRMAPNDAAKIEPNWRSIKPGEYKVVVSGKQRAGYFAGWKPWRLDTQRLKIWRDVEVRPPAIESESPESATVRQNVGVGVPNEGLHLRLVVPGTAVSLEDVKSGKQLEPIVPEASGSHSKAVWTTDAVPPRREIAVLYKLKRDAQSDRPWKEIIDEIQLYPRAKKNEE